MSEKTENYIHVSTVVRPSSFAAERASDVATDGRLCGGDEEGPWSDSWANRRFRAIQGCSLIVGVLKIT